MPNEKTWSNKPESDNPKQFAEDTERTVCTNPCYGRL